jgi:hypothetical protein
MIIRCGNIGADFGMMTAFLSNAVQLNKRWWKKWHWLRESLHLVFDPYPARPHIVFLPIGA